MSGVRGEGAFAVLVEARGLEAQGRSIIHMEIGEPDFPTAPHIVEAGKEALDQGWTKYGPTQGDPDLREAIAEVVSAQRGIEVDESQVVVTPGGKPILFFPILSLLEPGDEALYPNPGFPIYESMINYTGAKGIPIPLVESRGFSLDVNVIRENLTDKTKLLILNSPQNPTGGITPEEDIRAIAEMVLERDMMVLADEVYSRIYFDEKPFSITSIDGMLEKTILLDGFSKTLFHDRLADGLRRDAEMAARRRVSDDGQLQLTHLEFQPTRRHRGSPPARKMPWTKWSPSLPAGATWSSMASTRFPGFSCTKPGGAFYAFPNTSKTGIPSDELAHRVLHEAGVACLTGTSFGDYGEGYLRFSYATALPEIKEALERIDKMIRGG